MKVADLGILCQLDERRVLLDPIGDSSSVCSTREGSGLGVNMGTGRQNSNGNGNNEDNVNGPETCDISSERKTSGKDNDIEARTECTETAKTSDSDDSPSPPRGRLLSSTTTVSQSPMPHTKTFVGYVTHCTDSALFFTPSLSSSLPSSPHTLTLFLLPSHPPHYVHPPLHPPLSFSPPSTVTFMSPERIDGREYSYPSDVWAFGLSLMTLAKGSLPIDTQGKY